MKNEGMALNMQWELTFTTTIPIHTNTNFYFCLMSKQVMYDDRMLHIYATMTTAIAWCCTNMPVTNLNCISTGDV